MVDLKAGDPMRDERGTLNEGAKLNGLDPEAYLRDVLALLWQILLMLLSDADPSSAVRASLKRPNYEVDDGVAHGWQAWLRRWSVDSFFSASLLRDGDAGGRRKRSLS